MGEITRILKTTWGKIISAIAVGAIALLGYVTDVFTEWSGNTQETIETVVEE